ncbi:Diaminopimelate epimerase-like protein [Mollisia scopiformis]|uniref:Diaminopimelate epimerase-like protein n=1 Tax=Mollisia scopiformis TaxID=149040 RepID=A0A132B396_MOLSC|nr:Diaminopimelate epimerase-like protein [Mollisia scopiformis]KUJ06866.1 Diaminopimelate epimerase-like protein [Mollisia scopiformis]
MPTTQKSLPFTTLDVFTTTPYSGNPLAIVSLPSPCPLTQAQKQLIAKEFNLSETVFLHPSPDSSATVPEWEIDIFTTDEELPFAGHPTVGTASYVLGLAGKKKGVLRTKAGRIPVEVVQGVGVRAEVPFDTHLHGKTLSGEQRGLSKDASIRKAELEAPLFSIVKGMTFQLIQLPSLELLGKVEMTGLSPDFNVVLDEEWKPSFVSRYYYVLLDDGKGDGEVRIRSRMVEAKMEDPATGSAACALSAYLAGEWRKGMKFEIVQGVEMGRRSEIGVEVDVDVKADGGIGGVRLSGCAVAVMEGSLKV